MAPDACELACVSKSTEAAWTSIFMDERECYSKRKFVRTTISFPAASQTTCGHKSLPDHFDGGKGAGRQQRRRHLHRDFTKGAGANIRLGRKHSLPGPRQL